jgi:hypothetical protein
MSTKSVDASCGRGDKQISGGKCKVNWTRTTLPKEFGRLGVLDFNKFATTLRLHWLWQEWTSPKKSWVSSKTPCNEKDKLLFAASTTISVGNGRKTALWHSTWLVGQRPKDLAPHPYLKTRHKRRLLSEALFDTR